VTCGDWDLLKMLPQEFRNQEWALNTMANGFKRWVNIKTLFYQITNLS